MESILYDKKENGVCICRVCPRQCRIFPSRKGWCRTRWNDPMASLHLLLWILLKRNLWPGFTPEAASFLWGAGDAI